MVTIQEIETREEELRKIEEEAKQISFTPIPQRRYGAGITPEEQREAIERRSKARAAFPEIAKQRKELQDIRGQVLERERQQAELDLERSRVEQFESGRQAALSNRPTYGMSRRELAGYKAGAEELASYGQRKAYLEQKQKALEQGLKPIYDKGGKLVGFEDVKRGMSIPLENITKLSSADITRYEKAGIIEVERTTTSIPGETQTIIPRYKPFFGKVERIVKYPFEKLADLEDKYARKVFPGYEPGFGIIKPKVQSTTERSFGAKAFLFVGDVASFPIYGLKKIETYTFEKQSREEFKELPTLNKVLEISNIGLSLYAAGSLTRSAGKFLLKPVNIKAEPKLPEKYLAETKITNIRVGEKFIDIAEFKVTAISPTRRAFQVKNYEKILSGIREKEIEKLSLKQLSLIFPKGKVVELRPLRITQAITEPFIIRHGRIVRAVSRRGEPVVFSFRGAYNTLTGKTRISSKKLSILSGETYEAKTLRTLSPSRRELPTNIKKALEEIEKIKAPPGIKARQVFEKELKLEMGGVRVEDFLKITRKGVKFIPEGRRLQRGEIGAIQKSLMTKTYTGREFGLKEVEILGEKIGVVDVTFPRLRAPRKALKIEGRVERFEYEYPGKEPLGLFERMGGGGKKTKLKFDDFKVENQKAIQQAIGNVALKLSKTPPRARIPKAENVLAPIEKSLPAYAGTGLYERTDVQAAQMPPQMRNVQIGLPSYRLKTPSMNRELSKFVSREITKEVSKEITKELSKNIPKLTAKEVTKQANKQTTKQISKLMIKNINKNIPKIRLPGYTPKVRTGKTIPPLGFALKGERISKELSIGYKPFVTKKGKRIYLGPALPKGLALRKAEEAAKKSLRATFGAQPTRIRVRGEDIAFTPNKKLFRGYRIKAGKRIPLKDTFIQRLGKRLTFREEIAEIQAFKRRKK